MMVVPHVWGFLLVLVSIASPSTRAQEGTTCILPSQKGQSICTRLHYCNHFINLIKNALPKSPPPEVIEDMKLHNCGTNVRDRLICCPDNAVPLATTALPPPINLMVATTASPLGLPKPSDLNAIANHRNFKLINNKKCGKSETDRIIGGSIATLGEFKWMALLRYKARLDDTLTFNCGGALISDYYVLTAAHCINRDLVQIRLGEHDISSAQDCDGTGYCQDPVQDIAVDKAIKHARYDNSKKINDIALVRMKAPADLTKNNVRTICLPTNEEAQIGKVDIKARDKMLISGWGRVESGVTSNVLMKAYIPYITKDECTQKFTPFNIQIYDTYLCAGGRNKTDTCQGDSGGPIQTFTYFNGGARMVLYGVVSVGVRCLDPNAIFPGIYTNVANYLDWILDNME